MRRSGWVYLSVVLLAGAISDGEARPYFQAAGSNFQQTNPDGLVVMEAESFRTNTSQGGDNWTATTAFAGFSGTGALEVTPDDGDAQDTAFVANSPRLDFNVNFISTGTHYVWVRGWGKDGSSDSVHVGLNGAAVGTSDRITGYGAAFSWHKNTMDNVDATFTIATAGVHTINVWMREDGFVCDKILITTNAAYTPAGAGPAESAQLPAPTNVQATGGYNQVTVSWNPVAGATSYQIFRSQSATGPFGPPPLATVNAPATTTVDNTAAFPNTYYYVVRAVSAAGTSGNSTPPAAGVPLQPPVTALPNNSLQTNENGAITQFTVRYNIAQGTNSTLTVVSSDITEGSVTAQGLVTTDVLNGMGQRTGFSYVVPANTTPSITVVVTGVDDVIVDGNILYAIDVAASGVAVAIPDVMVTNNDNDVQGLTFTRTSGVTTSEGGGQDRFSVVLNRAPFGNVTFSLTSSNVLEGTVLPGTLTFTPTGGAAYNPANGFGGWNVGHDVTVTGVDDTLLDFSVPYTIVTGTLTFADPRDQAAFAAAGVTAAPDVGCLNLDNEVPPDLPDVWGGSNCGLVGLEAVLLLFLLRRRRKIYAP